MNILNVKSIILIMVCLQTCGVNKINMIDIGDTLPKGKVTETETYRITSSGSMEAMYRINVNGINYIICKDDSNKITYIETKDMDFITEEGLKIGMNYHEVLKYTDKEIQLEKGWAYILPLSNGWYAAFDLSIENLDEMPNDTSIRWFFKR